MTWQKCALGHTLIFFFTSGAIPTGMTQFCGPINCRSITWILDSTLFFRIFIFQNEAKDKNVDCMDCILIFTLPETNRTSPLKMLPKPKRKSTVFPTIHFQVREMLLFQFVFSRLDFYQRSPQFQGSHVFFGPKDSSHQDVMCHVRSGRSTPIISI